MKNASSGPINTRPTGVIVSGGDFKNDGRELFQPEPAKEGAAPARIRKSESTETAGHHVFGAGAIGAEPYARDSRLAAGKHAGLAQHAADSDAHESPAPTPESKQRAQYVASERSRKDEKTASETRTPLREC